MRPRSAVAATGVVVLLGAALAGCTRNTGGGGGDGSPAPQQTSVISTDPADSRGPAAPVPGAKRGGTLHLLTELDFPHLDPQRTYTFAGMSTLQLITRTLTVFREDGRGRLTLIGDLARNPGIDVNGDCRTWKYELKQGVKYQDGSQVTAKDVAYGIARSFEESIDGGATYIQEWLADSPDYNARYKGPYTSGQRVPPGLEVVDDHTLIFHLASPHCDLPYALALPTSAPVPPGRDTRTSYDTDVFSSGPYKIEEYVRDTRLVLERNPYWDPGTDPLRHDYPDQIVIEIGPDPTAATERVLADQGADRYALAWDGVPQPLVNNVLGDASLAGRLINKSDPTVWYLDINNERIADVNVRRAIAYAIDKEGLLATQGGAAAGTVIHTLLPDTTIGRVNYPNPYDGGPHGDPARARELLGGRKIKLVLLARTSALGQATAPVIKQSLDRAGFDVVIAYREDAYSAAKVRGNQYDLYLSNWGADWPSAVSTIPVLWDGRTIGPRGNSDVSYFNSEQVNARIDQILRMPANEAGPRWAELDQMIMRDYCPVVPLYQGRALMLMGSKVGGVFASDQFGTAVFYNAYLK